MTVAIIFVIPAHHSSSSSWQASNFCSLSCIHVLIPNHSACSPAACACNKFVRCQTVRCSSVTSCVCCGIVLSRLLLQLVGAKAVAGASILLLHFPSSFLSNSSNMAAPAAVGYRCCRHLHRHIHRRVAAPISRFSCVQVAPLAHSGFAHCFCEASLFSRVVLVVACLFVDASGQSCFCQDFS